MQRIPRNGLAEPDDPGAYRRTAIGAGRQDVVAARFDDASVGKTPVGENIAVKLDDVAAPGASL